MSLQYTGYIAEAGAVEPDWLDYLNSLNFDGLT
jgi:hypothetical protein